MSTTYNALESAIMQEENSSYPNNPGGLMSPSGSPLTFPSLGAGITALDNYVNNALSGNSDLYNPNEPLSEFENTYTGGDPNAANNIASMLGVSPSTPMSNLSDQNLSNTPSLFQSLKNSIGSQVSGVITLGRLLEPQNTAAFLIGLILVAAAVFGIDRVHETVVTAAKKGAETIAT